MKTIPSIIDVINPTICDEATHVAFQLGVTEFFKEEQKPFLLTITPIDRKAHSCRSHFDVWYLLPTDGSNFDVDPQEFHDTKWTTIEEADKVVTDPANRQALGVLRRMIETGLELA